MLVVIIATAVQIVVVAEITTTVGARIVAIAEVVAHTVHGPRAVGDIDNQPPEDQSPRYASDNQPDDDECH